MLARVRSPARTRATARPALRRRRTGSNRHHAPRSFRIEAMNFLRTPFPRTGWSTRVPCRARRDMIPRPSIDPRPSTGAAGEGELVARLGRPERRRPSAFVFVVLATSLSVWTRSGADQLEEARALVRALASVGGVAGDRKSTRLNSSHRTISYAVFCLKKK